MQPRHTDARAGRNTIRILRASSLEHLPWLEHGFSTRPGGVSEVYGGGALNLARTEQDTLEAVRCNRKRFFETLKPPAADLPWRPVTLRQIHSGIIHHVDGKANSPKDEKEQLAGDGLVTDEPGLLLCIKTADCLPVLLADPKRRAIGAMHAGWRGTLARIVEKGLGEMRRCFGTQPEDVVAAIGPGIHACCYSVGEEVLDQFASQFDYATDLFQERANKNEVQRKYPLLFMNMRAPGHGDPPRTFHLDLVEANRRQLMQAGVAEEKIATSDLCTACRTDLLFSHRAERGNTGRMLSVIGIRA